MANFKSVTEAEFKKFIGEYPNKLEVNVTTICEPPLINYNDFTRAPYWPDSVVASYTYGLDNYAILEDINQPVEDNGTRDTDTRIFDSNGIELRVGDVVKKWWGSSTVGPDDDFYKSICFNPKDQFEYDSETGLWNRYHYERITIQDSGTKYERWGFESCANLARGCAMYKVENPSEAILKLL